MEHILIFLTFNQNILAFDIKSTSPLLIYIISYEGDDVPNTWWTSFSFLLLIFCHLSNSLLIILFCSWNLSFAYDTLSTIYETFNNYFCISHNIYIFRSNIILLYFMFIENDHLHLSHHIYSMNYKCVWLGRCSQMCNTLFSWDLKGKF